MRLAWVSPLPPARSGIADYSAELVPILAQGAEIKLFAPDPWEATRLPQWSIHALAALPQEASHFDLVVYHIGNNQHHVGIYDLALRYPGAVVLHDYVLHHLVARCTILRDDLEGYLYHLAYERGPAGAAAGIRRLHRVFSEREQFLNPLNCLLLDRSRGVVVHSHWAAEQVHRQHPGMPICRVPHHLAPPPPDRREEFRRQLGLGPDDLVLATFGFLTPYKGIESLLRSYTQLVRDHPQVRCFLVGQPVPELNLAGLLAQLGLDGQVTVTGYLDMDRFYGYIAACDIAVNLRYPSAGETSGTLIRLLGGGKAVIISHLLQFAEWPDTVCLKVDPGASQDAMLLYYLRRLVEDPSLRARLGTNAQRYIGTYHALEGSAEAYLGFFEDLSRKK
jgi:glycosyltransferase involved in cell wall biosynthesis